MGTSVVARGLESSVWFIEIFQDARRIPAGTASFLLGFGARPGISAEPIQSFLTPELRFYPIERGVPCQVRTNGCGGFATALRECFNFLFHIFFAHIDVFSRRDPVQ